MSDKCKLLLFLIIFTNNLRGSVEVNNLDW